MIDNVLLLVEMLIVLLCEYEVLNDIFMLNSKIRFSRTIAVIVYFFLSVLIMFTSYDILNELWLLTIIFNILYLKLCFKQCSLGSILYVFTFLFLIDFFFSCIVIFIFNGYDYTEKRRISSITIFIAYTIFYIFIKTISYKSKGFIRLVPKGIKLIALCSMISITFLLIAVLNFSSIENITEWSINKRIFIVGLIFVILSIVPIMIINSIGKAFYDQKAKKFEEQIHIQAKHYEELAENNMELHRFKHDYKNVLIGAQELLASGNSIGALELLKKYGEELLTSEKSKFYFNTGNGIVDALLSDKQNYAKAANSKIVFTGAVPFEGIDVVDLCVIFGNAIDNAIEACELLDYVESKIEIFSDYNCGFWFLRVKNPVKKDIIINGNYIKTSKSDTINHGFGIYSLKHTVNKYDGEIKFNCSNQFFIMELEMSIKTNGETENNHKEYANTIA